MARMLARASVFALRLKICAMGRFQCQAETVALLNGAIISPPGSLQQSCGSLMKLMIINKSGAFHPYLETEFRKKISSGYLDRFSVFKIVFRVQDCPSYNRLDWHSALNANSSSATFAPSFLRWNSAGLPGRFRNLSLHRRASDRSGMSARRWPLRRRFQFPRRP